ncbi:MAG TPA: protein kinase [Pirellulaceae bacterium]|nr:protein kinase [Pirellulaceae bacterium]
MQPHDRYEILGLIGNGDFAAVYRARDRELGRDVAIKQIHGQYLSDPRRLERFWREAQLLASLQHPHVLTIYDVVRPRGWLVLELMHGTIQDAARGQPLDLEMLRSALIGSLSALAMLHGNQVLHGDIKPSNLLLDRQGRVKLGDFGLARRVASDQGSYLKGATRYMAPELVAPQFGPVCPASDLYSLGFTAYELLCGPQQFENLFPGLDAFGRDRQIAWMMWHAAPDRRLPPVGSVLDGVPTDVARVIDRLTTKDQSRRYRSADEALADLSAQGAVAVPAEDDGAAEAGRKKFQKRLVAGLALCASLLICTLILVMPGKKPPPPAPPPPVAIRGAVRTLLPERQTVIIEQAGDLGPKEIVVRSNDRVLLNDKVILFSELREADQVTIQTLKDDQGRPLLEIAATRPQASQGTITRVAADIGELVLALAAGGELKLNVGQETPIELNGESRKKGQPLALADLAAGDRVAVQHYRPAEREEAMRIVAQRIVPGKGVVRAIDLKKGQISIADGPEDGSPVTIWRFAPQPEITLNGRRVLNSRLLTPADLQVGDQVSFQRDVLLVSVAAQRQFADSGTVRAIRYDVRSLTAAVAGGAERTFVLAPQCTVTLGGQSAAFDDLRRGDTFHVTFDEPEAVSPAVTSIAAQRPRDASKWVVAIAGAAYDDSSVPAMPTAAAAVARLQAALAARYAVPPEQVLVLSDPSRVRLEQGLSESLAKTASAGQLWVVVAGRVLSDGKNPPLVAPRDFARARADATGVPLTTILSAVEGIAVKDKLVLLELHSVGGLSGQKSAAALVDSVRGTRSKPLLRTTPVLALDSVPATDAPAALVEALATGALGAADPNRDNLITLAELTDYLKSSAASSVRLILPETTPPRLTDDAKEAIRRVAAAVAQQKIDSTDAMFLISAADRLAPKQPEPKLVGGILLLKARQHNDAIDHLAQVVAQYPRTPLAWEVSAWARFEKLNFTGGISDLTQMIRNLPEGTLPDADRRAIPWVGRLREFAANAASVDRRPPPAAIEALDAAVATRSEDVQMLYRQGREAVSQIIQDFDRRVLAADPNEQIKIKLDRVALRHYTAFSLEAASQQALATLDVE